MKITCPSCAAEYNVPGAVAPGRVARCVKCGTEWAPVPPRAVEPPPLPMSVSPDPAPAPEPAAPRPVPPPPPAPPARRLPLVLAWLGSVAVIAAALAAAFVFRDPVMRKWPPSQRVYGALGLRAAASPNVHGDVPANVHGDAPPSAHGAASPNVHGNVAE